MRHWTRRYLIIFSICFAPYARAALTPKCGAAHDLMVQALERVGPDSPASVVRDANELLKRSEQMCGELGDAWYYRSLFETRLNNAAAARFSLSQATRLGSEAMNEQTNPFVLSTPKGGTTPAAITGGTRWALVIGIGQFSDPSFPVLKYTADDAKLFADTLEDPAVGGFPTDHVKKLVNGEATTVGIRGGLNWIARSAKPEDLVVIYVATHGSARELDSVAGANYLITQDTLLGPNQDQDMLFGSALPMNDMVTTVANRIKALRTAIFIDTCYSGSTKARGESVSERDLHRFGEGQGRMIMTAARPDQESRESDDLKHGYFTYFLVQALRSPHSANLETVYQQVAKEVAQRVAKDTAPMSVQQDPVLSRSSDQTDFALNAARK